MAIRVADIVIQALEEKQTEWDKALVEDLQEFVPPAQDEEPHRRKMKTRNRCPVGRVVLPGAQGIDLARNADDSARRP